MPEGRRFVEPIKWVGESTNGAPQQPEQYIKFQLSKPNRRRRLGTVFS
jgi:hypothetical protein